MGGLSPETKAAVFPRGPEGITPGEGDFLLSEDERATLYLEQGRQEALKVAQETARAEGRAAAQKGIAEALDGRKDQINAFKSFLGSLQDLVQGAESEGAAPDGRTEVVLKLHRVVDNGGPRPGMVFQKQWVFSAEDALSLGDPDFEGRTMAWAKETGRFGKFQWRIMGWAAGENTLDTTYSVMVEEPEGYKPPAIPKQPEPEPAPAPADPLTKFREGLTLVEEVQRVMGGSKGQSSAASDVARMAGEMDGRRKAEEEARARFQTMEDRHRKELEERDAAAYKRGHEDGDRKARWELEDQIRELKWKMRQEEGPDMLDKLVGFAGGPEGVSSLVGAVVNALNRKGQSAPTQKRPAPQPVGPSTPRLAAPMANPATVSEARSPEPSRKEHVDAMMNLDEAIALLEEAESEGATDPAIPQALELLKAAHEDGKKEGSLGPWWKAWRENLGPMVAHILKTAEGPLEMNLESFKALLVQRLDEGADDAAILAEARALLSPEQIAEWKPMLAAFPKIFLGRLLGAPHHQDRLVGLVESFIA